MRRGVSAIAAVPAAIGNFGAISDQVHYDIAPPDFVDDAIGLELNLPTLSHANRPQFDTAIKARSLVRPLARP